MLLLSFPSILTRQREAFQTELTPECRKTSLPIDRIFGLSCWIAKACAEGEKRFAVRGPKSFGLDRVVQWCLHARCIWLLCERHTKTLCRMHESLLLQNFWMWWLLGCKNFSGLQDRCAVWASHDRKTRCSSRSNRHASFHVCRGTRVLPAQKQAPTPVVMPQMQLPRQRFTQRKLCASDYECCERSWVQSCQLGELIWIIAWASLISKLRAGP